MTDTIPSGEARSTSMRRGRRLPVALTVMLAVLMGLVPLVALEAVGASPAGADPTCPCSLWAAETLPAIVGELLRGRLGDAIRDRIGAAGAESRDELESIFYEPDAPILGLTPPTGVVPTGEVHHLPKYRWTIS